MHISRTLARWFPVPRLLAPCDVGIDVSDTSIKWLEILQGREGHYVGSYGNQRLSAGVVLTGVVRDPQALGMALRDLRKSTRIDCAHAALPEEGAYVFNMHVPSQSSHEHIINMIEFELVNRVPIPPAQAVYDFDFVEKNTEHGDEIAVTVFPRDLAEGYVQAFSIGGIRLMSLEIEARSIARAISGREREPVTLLVDCGRARTGVAILKRGVPIFTSTVDIGGDHVTSVAKEVLGLTSDEEVEIFKNEFGLVSGETKYEKATIAVEKVAASLAEQIARHYRFWDTRRGESGAHATSVERVYLLGGSANLRGLPEYIAGKVHALTERPNVWRNVCVFDEYIPPIPYRASFQYATAIGLALRSQ